MGFFIFYRVNDVLTKARPSLRLLVNDVKGRWAQKKFVRSCPLQLIHKRWTGFQRFVKLSTPWHLTFCMIYVVRPLLIVIHTLCCNFYKVLDTPCGVYLTGCTIYHKIAILLFDKSINILYTTRDSHSLRCYMGDILYNQSAECKGADRGKGVIHRWWCNSCCTK